MKDLRQFISTTIREFLNENKTDIFNKDEKEALISIYRNRLFDKVRGSDLYKKYVELFDLQGKEQTIYRAILFLEDWKPGHYAEYNYSPFVDWRIGDCVVWQYDMPHMAANLGLDPRYTLQITGHI